MVMKTPGVFIVEKNAFPNSIVEVATAVPAFIGYTQFAIDRGNSLHNSPWQITSLAEFEAFFGGPPTASHMRFSLQPAPAQSAGAPAQAEAPTATRTEPSTPLSQRDARPIKVVGADGVSSDYLLKQTAGFYLLYYSMLHFFQNGGGRCYIVSVGTYDTTPGIHIRKDALLNGMLPLEKAPEPTLIVIPEAVLLSQGDCFDVQEAAIRHCGHVMKNRFAILDIWEGYWDPGHFQHVDEFRDGINTDCPGYAAAYFPWVNTSILSLADLGYQNIDEASWGTLQGAMTSELDPKAAAGALAELTKHASARPPDIDFTADAKTVAAALVAQTTLNKTLLAISPFFGSVLAEMLNRVNLMPPSPAMAGIYTFVDNQHGVWKAPANVSMNKVLSPTLAISNQEQEDLNVTPQGKSINAIRSFSGQGTIVWGARTLDGNSLDWRYINVRRTMIMLEESIRLAAQAMVFEPNAAGTWVTTKAMISNFLTGIWTRGGLAGVEPQDAFSVHVGLGDTMTADDLVKRIMRVTVLVALIRPAEFIEITLEQQQKS